MSTATKQKPNRTGVSKTFWLDANLVEAMDAYIDATKPHPTGVSTVEAALESFLEEKGFWPWPREADSE